MVKTIIDKEKLAGVAVEETMSACPKEEDKDSFERNYEIYKERNENGQFAAPAIKMAV